MKLIEGAGMAVIVALLSWMAFTTQSTDKKLAVIEAQFIELAGNNQRIRNLENRITVIEYKQNLKGLSHE